MTANKFGKIYHIPVCPFCQRLQILLNLKGCEDSIEFIVVDITVPRAEWLLEKTGGSTALPIFELTNGKVVKESLVIMRLIDELIPDRPVAARDPYLHALEGMMEKFDDNFTFSGYMWVMNQDAEKKTSFEEKTLKQYKTLNDFLVQHNPSGTFLLEEFGWVEAIYTPIFQRFWFLEYFEDFSLPDTPEYARVKKWIVACLAHPAAQQANRDEIIKLYYDYAKGAGNGKLLPCREKSSFSFEPHWRERPLPPRDKYTGLAASDSDLGLL